MYGWYLRPTVAGEQASAWCKLTGVVNRECEKQFFSGPHLDQKAMAQSVKYRCH